MNTESLSADVGFASGSAKEIVSQCTGAHEQAPASIPNGDAGRSAGWIALMVIPLLLGGCATCSEHPKACAIGTAVIAGSLALSLDRHSHPQQAIPHEPHGIYRPRTK